MSINPLSNLKSLSSLSPSILNPKRELTKITAFSNINSLKKDNEAQQCSSLSDLIAGHKKLNSKSAPEVKSTNSSFSSLSALTSHHLSKSGTPSFSLNKGPKFSLDTKNEKPFLKHLPKLENTFSDNIVNNVVKDVSSLTLDEKENDKLNVDLNNEMEVVEQTESSNLKSCSKSSLKSSLGISHNSKSEIIKKVSPLGKVLCRRWKTKSPISFPKKKAWYFQTSPHIKRFDFVEMSPDSKILQFLRKKI